MYRYFNYNTSSKIHTFDDKQTFRINTITNPNPNPNPNKSLCLENYTVDDLLKQIASDIRLNKYKTIKSIGKKDSVINICYFADADFKKINDELYQIKNSLKYISTYTNDVYIINPIEYNNSKVGFKDDVIEHNNLYKPILIKKSSGCLVS